jgi:hypothetical protein
MGVLEAWEDPQLIFTLLLLSSVMTVGSSERGLEDATMFSRLLGRCLHILWMLALWFDTAAVCVAARVVNM